MTHARKQWQLVPCGRCGIEFDPKPNKKGPPRRYCSDCAGVRKPRVGAVCDQCGTIVAGGSSQPERILAQHMATHHAFHGSDTHRALLDAVDLRLSVQQARALCGMALAKCQQQGVGRSIIDLLVEARDVLAVRPVRTGPNPPAS